MLFQLKTVSIIKVLAWLISDSMYIYVSFFQTFVTCETCLDMFRCFYFLVMLSANYCADPFINSTQLCTLCFTCFRRGCGNRISHKHAFNYTVKNLFNLSKANMKTNKRQLVK